MHMFALLVLFLVGGDHFLAATSAQEILVSNLEVLFVDPILLDGTVQANYVYIHLAPTTNVNAVVWYFNGAIYRTAGNVSVFFWLPSQVWVMCCPLLLVFACIDIHMLFLLGCVCICADYNSPFCFSGDRTEGRCEFLDVNALSKTQPHVVRAVVTTSTGTIERTATFTANPTFPLIPKLVGADLVSLAWTTATTLHLRWRTATDFPGLLRFRPVNSSGNWVQVSASTLVLPAGSPRGFHRKVSLSVPSQLAFLQVYEYQVASEPGRACCLSMCRCIIVCYSCFEVLISPLLFVRDVVLVVFCILFSRLQGPGPN